MKKITHVTKDKARKHVERLILGGCTIDGIRASKFPNMIEITYQDKIDRNPSGVSSSEFDSICGGYGHIA